jgi:hypothetical protein
LVAGIKAAAPDRTLQQIAAQLEVMRERTLGGTRWYPSSIKHLLSRAGHLGLAGTASAKLGPTGWLERVFLPGSGRDAHHDGGRAPHFHNAQPCLGPSL